MKKRRLLKIKQIILASLIFFLVSLFFPSALLAAYSGNIGVTAAEKGGLKYNLAPGESREDAVKVINTAAEDEVRIKIYAVDAETTPDGAFALKGEGARDDLGAWIELSLNEVTVPPASTELVPFTITVPPVAEPGDHMGGIVIQRAGPLEEKEGDITILTRVGTRVINRVPGDIVKELEITSFDWRFVKETEEEIKEVIWGKLQSFLGFRRKMIFSVGLHNKGTIRLETLSHLTVTNMFGKEIATIEFPSGMVFPKKSITNGTNWLKEGSLPLFGRYQAKVTAFDPNNEDLVSPERQLIFWAIPYTLFVVLGVLFALVVLLYLSRLLVKELAKREMEVYLVRQGDSLALIAQHFGVGWKKLAKINNIKKPFHLRPGQQILIPRQPILRLFFRQLLRKKSNLWVIIIIVALIILGIGGWIFSQYQIREESGEPAPEPTENRIISFQASEAETRDNTRKEDLKKIQTALEEFYQRHKRYPLALAIIKTNEEDNVLLQELVAGGYLAELLKDPQDPSYYYGYKSNGQTYELTSILENKNDPDAVLVKDYAVYKLTSKK